MSVGGKTRTNADGEVAKGWDHDPPAKVKLVPFGILMVASGALTLIFGSRETSDAWVDALRMWWGLVKADLGHVKRLVIYLDNGPKNSGRRTQFLIAVPPREFGPLRRGMASQEPSAHEETTSPVESSQ